MTQRGRRELPLGARDTVRVHGWNVEPALPSVHRGGTGRYSPTPMPTYRMLATLSALTGLAGTGARAQDLPPLMPMPHRSLV